VCGPGRVFLFRFPSGFKPSALGRLKEKYGTCNNNNASERWKINNNSKNGTKDRRTAIGDGMNSGERGCWFSDYKGGVSEKSGFVLRR